MSAYLTYEIKGLNGQGKEVSVLIKLLASPPEETALFLIRERYPSVKAGSVKVTIPVAHKYPKRHGPVRISTMESTAIRRTR